MEGTRLLTIRRSAASLLSAALAAFLFRELWVTKSWLTASTFEWAFLGSIVLVPLAAAALIWSRRITAQLLVRGTWWAMLLMGAVGSTLGSDTDARHACVIALGSATALLALGGTGLGSGSGDRFQPVAFRGTLLLALVLAMADTGALLWFGIGSAHFDGLASVLLPVPLMIAGIIGLIRLRTWGLVVGMLANLLVAVLALARVLPLPDPLRALFVGTATLQLLVPIPMLVTIVRRRAPGPDRWRRAKTWTAATAIAGIAAVSAYAALLGGGPLLRR